MATLTFMNQTIFDHGASEQLGQVLAQHGISRPTALHRQRLGQSWHGDGSRRQTG